MTTGLVCFVTRALPDLWLTPEGEGWCHTGGVSSPALSILSHVRPVCCELSEQGYKQLIKYLVCLSGLC